MSFDFVSSESTATTATLSSWPASNDSSATTTSFPNEHFYFQQPEQDNKQPSTRHELEARSRNVDGDFDFSTLSIETAPSHPHVGEREREALCDPINTATSTTMSNITTLYEVPSQPPHPQSSFASQQNGSGSFRFEIKDEFEHSPLTQRGQIFIFIDANSYFSILNSLLSLFPSLPLQSTPRPWQLQPAQLAPLTNPLGTVYVFRNLLFVRF
jgi:hypothetical protein